MRNRQISKEVYDFFSCLTSSNNKKHKYSQGGLSFLDMLDMTQATQTPIWARRSTIFCMPDIAQQQKNTNIRKEVCHFCTCLTWCKQHKHQYFQGAPNEMLGLLEYLLQNTYCGNMIVKNSSEGAARPACGDCLDPPNWRAHLRHTTNVVTCRRKCCDLQVTGTPAAHQQMLRAPKCCDLTPPLVSF